MTRQVTSDIRCRLRCRCGSVLTVTKHYRDFGGTYPSIAVQLGNPTEIATWVTEHKSHFPRCPTCKRSLTDWESGNTAACCLAAKLTQTELVYDEGVC